ncbi:MurR/RpiR family transcriptional regulator [Mesorhizobium microcysteis]|jgi:DNA-binding MurR/RpiR family transcriptional regulator|uniref:MurR/RpiR family transcriptional regulator n=1 Tax=Neoaquamicrobium microcysteis TaxID=2682781 RepID=A0A5D4GTM8_9HYPH|nr:MurR/RpiR family transcriptional regulator [Mesorhizobium microcysteis]TYR32066.1 MurR/RpiR family transcriptional regulator [Mesorhizobium microcysteis]
MDISQDLTVAERMRSGFEELTRAERQLANAMLANYPVLGLDSITAVAQVSGVSTPTVVRMAKKLGFAGFPEMQAALRGELEATISNPIAKHDRWAASAPDTHILNRFADQVMENLRQTLRQLSPETFNAVVALLSDPSRTVHMVGGRITRSLAEYFFTHMQVIRGGVVQVASNANTWPHYVLEMREGDVLVAFDVRRYEQEMLRLAEMARAKGVLLVLFTDQWGSPAAKLATHSFHARIEAPSAWDSSVVTLFIVEAIIAAVQDENWEETRARMKSLEDLFDQTRMFRKFV